MSYTLTRLYVCVVLTVMSILAVMATVVFALGGGRVDEVARPKGLPAGMTVPPERLFFTEERVKRSPEPALPSSPPAEEANNADDTFYDVEDPDSVYKIARLTKHNPKYYSIAYRTNDDDEDRALDEYGGGDIAPVDGDD